MFFNFLGKSPMIVFPENCDIKAAADWYLFIYFCNKEAERQNFLGIDAVLLADM